MTARKITKTLAGDIDEDEGNGVLTLLEMIKTTESLNSIAIRDLALRVWKLADRLQPLAKEDTKEQNSISTNNGLLDEIISIQEIEVNFLSTLQAGIQRLEALL